MRSTLLFIFIVYCAFLSAQNIILNGSFEQLNLKKGWVDGGSEVFFVSDTGIAWGIAIKEFAQVCSAHWGYTGDSLHLNLSTYYSDSGFAQSGKCFGVIRMFDVTYDYKKATFASMIAAFETPLSLGKTYKLSFYIKHFTGNSIAQQLFLQWLPDERISVFKDVELVRGRVPLLVDNDVTAINLPFSIEYKKIEIHYKAKGGERYLAIGNLLQKMPAKKDRVPSYGIDKKSGAPHCWLAIDGVELYAFEDKPFVESPPAPVIERPALNLLETLATFYFNTDSFTANVVLANSLKSMCAALSIAGEVVIEGHTDSTGDEEYNQPLSEKRAKAIADILRKECGVAATVKGFGSSQPLSQISAGQSNRRVVVKYLPLK